MPSIPYNSFDRYLQDLHNTDMPTIFPVYLIHGDEFLCKNALKSLTDYLIPPESKSLNYETIDGLKEDIQEALEKVNTYPFFSGRKAVCFTDARFFKSSSQLDPLIAKIKSAWEEKELSRAGQYFVRLLSALNLSYDDISPSDGGLTIKGSGKDFKNEAWPGEMIRYCRKNNLEIPESKDDAMVLKNALDKGFPKRNHLIITTDTLDKRRVLYLSIQKAGLIIDCSVPLGKRAADKRIQKVVLKERMKATLSRFEKTMDPSAFQSLYEKTGFELRTFSSNLEKLIQYTGSRKQITKVDIESALVRTKKDPIFEFTQAIADRNIQNALFYLTSLLADDFHTLQMLAAITKQVRKLLVAKDFVESHRGHIWYAGCQFNHFKTNVLPAIQKFDEELIAELRKWEKQLTYKERADETVSGKRKPRKKTPKTDLTLADNPNNPYPIYQTLKKSDGYAMDHLIYIIGEISKTDRLLKSTGRNPKLVLEALIFKICR